MCHFIWKLLIAFCVLRIIDGGVKIEISRVKNAPKMVQMTQNVESNETMLSAAEPKISSSSSTTTTTITMPSTESTKIMSTTEANIINLTNTKTNANTNTNANVNTNPNTNSNSNSSIPTNDTKKLIPQNGTDVVSSVQTNVTNTTTSFVNSVNNLTTAISIASSDLNLYFAEFARREMRRKLIPADYYCPCDLKVNLKLLGRIYFQYSIINQMKLK